MLPGLQLALTAAGTRAVFVTQGYRMSRIHLEKTDELTRALAERIECIWEAYLALDEHAIAALLADDFRAIHPHGSVHLGKASRKDMATLAIEDYRLREL